MAELWLVCEGEPGSVDVALLQRVFANVLAAEIVVEPACGSSPSPVARFLENRRGGKAAFVHDRDYRPRAEAEASLVDGKPGFLWRRHSIENYLLPPPIILQAFQNLRERFEQQRPGRVPPWIAALPANPEEVAEALASAHASEQRKKPAAWPINASGTACPRTWAGPEAQPHRAGHGAIRVSGEKPYVRRRSGSVARRRRRPSARSCREAVIRLFDAAYAEVTADAYRRRHGILDRFPWSRSAEGVPPMARLPQDPAVLQGALQRTDPRGRPAIPRGTARSTARTTSAIWPTACGRSPDSPPLA